MYAGYLKKWLKFAMVHTQLRLKESHRELDILEDNLIATTVITTSWLKK